MKVCHESLPASPQLRLGTFRVPVGDPWGWGDGLVVKVS